MDKKHHEHLMAIVEDQNRIALQKNYNGMLNRKVNANAIKDQVVTESKNKTLGTKINSNYDKQILKDAMDQMTKEKKKEDSKRIESIAVAQDTLEINKKQQKEKKKQAEQEREEERLIEE